MANKHLRPLFEENVNKQITISDIIDVVSRKYRVSEEDIVSKSRQSSIVMPRFVAMFLSTRLTNITTTEIGKQFGNRDHSTVINARNNIEEKISTDDTLKDLIDELISELKG
jgi:chromosomal replication initiator protein